MSCSPFHWFQSGALSRLSAAFLKASPSYKIHWTVLFVSDFLPPTALDIPSFLKHRFSCLLGPPALWATPQSSLLALSSFIDGFPACFCSFFIILPLLLNQSPGYKYCLYVKDSQICNLVPDSPLSSTLAYPVIF